LTIGCCGSPAFYADGSHLSIASEQPIHVLAVHAPYSICSKRMLMGQLDYNLLLLTFLYSRRNPRLDYIDDVTAVPEGVKVRDTCFLEVTDHVRWFSRPVGGNTTFTLIGVKAQSQAILRPMSWSAIDRAILAAERPLRNAGASLAQMSTTKAYNPFAVIDLVLARGADRRLGRVDNYRCSRILGPARAPTGARPPSSN
jgi:hypothetical protein